MKNDDKFNRTTNWWWKLPEYLRAAWHWSPHSGAQYGHQCQRSPVSPVDGLMILSGQKSTPKSNMSLLLPLSMYRFAVLLSILSKFNMSFQCMQMLRSPHIGHSPEPQWILTWRCRKLGWSDWKTISVCHIMITVKELLHKILLFVKLCSPGNDGPLDLRKSFRCPGRRIVPRDPSHMYEV